MLLSQNNFEPVKKDFLARASRISLPRRSAIPRRKAPPRAGPLTVSVGASPQDFNFLNVDWFQNEAGPIKFKS
jgi:hypothetical protein